MADYTRFFENTFLFKDLSTKDASLILSDAEIEERTYQKGETIYSPDGFGRKIGFVYKGECTVSRQSGENMIPLNTAARYDSFGILTCFSEEREFPTVVTARTVCTVLFIRAEELEALIEKNHLISINIIRFLSNKINFLNDKIAAFSGGSIEEKLAKYLLGLKKKHGSSEFDFNKKKSAESLNCGRASLYRAIDALEKSGYVTIENKKIIINDPEGLERI